MDIFKRNWTRVQNIADAINRAEEELRNHPLHQKIEMLKKQRKMLPNFQGFTMADLMADQFKEMPKAAVDAFYKGIDEDNEKAWTQYEEEYQNFCQTNQLETF